MDGKPNNHPHETSAKSFIDHCKDVFKWHDLAGTCVMDVGCGEEGFCGKAILDKFPDVKVVIGIDSNKHLVGVFRAKIERNLKTVCECRNIEIKKSIQEYAGEMDKVISTYVFGELAEKEEAFRNVFYLLKPGGEAAVLFVVKTSTHEWLEEMLKNPKWKHNYKNYKVNDSYKGADYYREMVEKIGFQVNECKEYERIFTYSSVEVCKDMLYQTYKMYFNIPLLLREVFKDECLQVLLNLSTKDAEGRFCNTFTELSLLVTKPIYGA